MIAINYRSRRDRRRWNATAGMVDMNECKIRKEEEYDEESGKGWKGINVFSAQRGARHGTKQFWNMLYLSDV